MANASIPVVLLTIVTNVLVTVTGYQAVLAIGVTVIVAMVMTVASLAVIISRAIIVITTAMFTVEWAVGSALLVVPPPSRAAIMFQVILAIMVAQ